MKTVNYSGSPAKKFFSFLTGLGALASSVCCVTTENNATITLTSDESQIEDLPLLCSFFNKIIDELGIE